MVVSVGQRYKPVDRDPSLPATKIFQLAEETHGENGAFDLWTKQKSLGGFNLMENCAGQRRNLSQIGVKMLQSL